MAAAVLLEPVTTVTSLPAVIVGIVPDFALMVGTVTEAEPPIVPLVLLIVNSPSATLKVVLLAVVVVFPKLTEAEVVPVVTEVTTSTEPDPLIGVILVVFKSVIALAVVGVPSACSRSLQAQHSILELHSSGSCLQ